MAIQETRKIVKYRQAQNCMKIVRLTATSTATTVTTRTDRSVNCTVQQQILATIRRATEVLARVERDYMCQAAYAIPTTCIKTK